MATTSDDHIPVPDPTGTKTHPQTQDVLAALLNQNTGRHLLDSGDAYGRHWERNRQINDFDHVEPVTVDIHGEPGETPTFVSATVHVYHWLKHRLEYTDEAHTLTCAFHQYAQAKENADRPWWPLLQEWTGSNCTVNTYNRENVLSQVTQFVVFDLDEHGRPTDADPYGPFIGLQIHNGCDVRGGYTTPVIFEVPHLADGLLFQYSNVDAMCDGCDAHWWSDDAGSHWYSSGNEGLPVIVRETDGEQTLEHADCGGRVTVTVPYDV